MEVRIEHISKRYGRKQVLRDVSLQAQSGRCIGILGANGSGKSTFLSILAGVLRPGGGSFAVDGQDVFKDARLRADLVGFVPQGTPLLEELTAWDNLRLWYDSAALRQELESGVLRTLGIGDFLKTPVKKMSGGMKKRLSIGCAVAGRPPIVLLDEPTAALDLACKRAISDYLLQYKAAGGLLILTTHDVLELQLCDSWYILKDGVLVPYEFDGNVDALVRAL